MRHLQVYCEHEPIKNLREATNECLEMLLWNLKHDAEKLKENSLLPKNLMLEINRIMSEISVNDCGLPGSEHPGESVGAKITIATEEWENIKVQPTHRLFKQANAWPLASSCGFLTSRAEDEWNEDWTSSGDLTYIGAMPRLITDEIQHYCQEAMEKTRGAAEKEAVKNMCKNIKASWKAVKKFA